jgi:hypothetical protein
MNSLKGVVAEVVQDFATGDIIRENSNVVLIAFCAYTVDFGAYLFPFPFVFLSPLPLSFFPFPLFFFLLLGHINMGIEPRLAASSCLCD